MQSQAKASEVKLPEVHGVNKGVDPNLKPERQILKSPNPITQPNKHRSGQSRAGLRRKMKAPTQGQIQVQPRNVSQMKEYTLSKQKEGIQTPLIKQTVDRHIEQSQRLIQCLNLHLDQRWLKCKFLFTQIDETTCQTAGCKNTRWQEDKLELRLSN